MSSKHGMAKLLAISTVLLLYQRLSLATLACKRGQAKVALTNTAACAGGGYINSSCNPNEGWRYFKNVLNSLMEKHIPTITIKDQGRPPWFDSETLNLCKKKQRLHKKYKASKTPADYTRFSQCRKKLKLMIEEKMETNLNDDENDPALISKKFWGHLKSTNKSTRIPESVYYNSRHRNNPKDQTVLFNKFFADQFSEASLYDVDMNSS